MYPGKGDCQRWRVMSGGVAISQSEWDVPFCGGIHVGSCHSSQSDWLWWLYMLWAFSLADSDYSPITTAFTFLSCARDVVVDRRSTLSQSGLAFFWYSIALLSDCFVYKCNACLWFILYLLLSGTTIRASSNNSLFFLSLLLFYKDHILCVASHSNKLFI